MSKHGLERRQRLAATYAAARIRQAAFSTLMLDRGDAMQSILDRKLLLLQLLDRHRIGMRPVQDPLNFLIQMPMVALQALSLQ